MKQIALIVFSAVALLQLLGCNPMHYHPAKSIRLNTKPYKKTFYVDLPKARVYMDANRLIKRLHKSHSLKEDLVRKILAVSDTVSYKLVDSLYYSRYNNHYLVKFLKKGKATVVAKSDNGVVKRIQRRWTNHDCEWGYGYFLPGDSAHFYLHIFKLCPFL